MSQSDLGKKTAHAALWAFLSVTGAKTVTLIGLMLLARILAPREFGLLAFAMAYLTYAETIGDLGSGMALVYWPDRRRDAAQVTFIVNVVAGTLWCLSTLIFAKQIADFFSAPNGAAIVRVLAFSFIIKFLGTTHDALAQKDLRFRARAVPEFALGAVKAVISIVLAKFGFGAWSLVWGHIAGLTCSTIFLWSIVKWRPTWSFPRDLFKPMLSYGRGIVTINVLNAVVSRADLAIVSRYLGVTALGLYQMAGKIPETTITVLVWVISKVLFPTFSRLHAAGEGLREAYLTATRYVSALTIPMAAGLYILAAPIMRLFFGKQWDAAAPMLAVLAVYSAARSLSTHAGDALKATGRSQLLARLSVIKAIVMVPALLIASQWNATAVAWAATIVSIAATIMTLTIASRTLDIPLTAILRSFAPSFIAGGAMSVVLVLLARLLAPRGPAIEVAIAIPAGTAVYAIVLWLLDRDIFTSARSTLFARRSVPAAS